MELQLLDDTVLGPAGARVRCAIRRGRQRDTPFRFWLLRDVLPVELCRAVATLPFAARPAGETFGKRETHNGQRIFVTAGNRRRHAACEALAEAFQDEATTALIEDVCDVTLGGSFLRIECCLDTDGFWLEPHTDIGTKLFTMLVYLSTGPQAEDWGTDIMDAAGRVLATAPGSFNAGLIFIPGPDTWHGFARRPIHGVRRSLIINYVKPEWRSRHELAFPDQPVVTTDFN
jgi:hypothetical protein